MRSSWTSSWRNTPKNDSNQLNTIQNASKWHKFEKPWPTRPTTESPCLHHRGTRTPQLEQQGRHRKDDEDHANIFFGDQVGPSHLAMWQDAVICRLSSAKANGHACPATVNHPRWVADTTHKLSLIGNVFEILRTIPADLVRLLESRSVLARLSEIWTQLVRSH